VAIWLSRYNNDFLDLVVQNDFEILFYQGNIQFDDKAKEKLIEAYIKTLVQGEIYNDWKHNFKVLNYKGLADKIIVELKKKTHTGTISFLIQLARFCDDKSKLKEPMLKLAFDKNLSTKPRSEAVCLLNSIGDIAVTNQFINHLRIEDNFKNKNDYRFKGILVTAIFRELPLEELLQFLSNDKQVKCSHYCDEGLTELNDYIVSIAESDEDKLKQLLLHYSNVDKQEIRPYSIDKSLVDVAIQKINKTKVEDILVKFIGTQTILNDKADIKDHIFRWNKTLNLANKQRLLKKLAVFLINKNDDDLFYGLKSQINAIHEEDNSWIFNTIKNEEIDKLKECWFEFIRWTCSYQKRYWYEYANHGIINHLDYLYDVYQKSNYEPFKIYYKQVFEGVDLESDEAKYLRESLNKYNKSRAKRKEGDLQKIQKREDNFNWLKQAVEIVKEGDLSYWGKIIRKYRRFGFETHSFKDDRESVLVLKAAKLFFQKVELPCNCGDYSCYDCGYKNNEILYAMHAIKNYDEEFLEKQSEKNLEYILYRTVTWLVNEITKSDDYFHFEPNIWKTITYVFKISYDIIPQKTDELIINQFNTLRHKNNISEDKIYTLIHQEWDIQSEAINGLIYDSILEDNTFKAGIDVPVFYKIIQKLIDESYPPFFKNVNYWIENIASVKEADFEKMSEVFFALFASENSEVDLSKTIDAFIKNEQFEEYFIIKYANKSNLFTKSIPKLTNNDCRKWFSHLEKLYPEDKNSVVYNDSKPALKNILLKIRVEKYLDFDVINELNSIKSKFDEKSGSTVIADKIYRYTQLLSQRCWQPLTPKQLLEIAKENKLSVQTEKQLQDLVLKKLMEIQKELKQNKTHLESLWNTVKGQEKPKSEDQISDYIKLQLEPKLKKAIANRETKVGKHKGVSGWGRIDLSIDLKNDNEEKISLLVEAKGDFYSENVIKPMAKQLKEGYLGGNPSNFGIYLVYYTGDQRFKNLQECQNTFEKEANKLSNENYNIKSFVLDITFAQEWIEN